MRAVVAAVILLAPAIATADVRGHVVDDDGEPVAGATVDAGDAGTATTDADGAFTIAAPGEVDAIVYADDFLPAVVSFAAGADDARVELSPESSDGEVIHVSGKPPDMAEPTEYVLDADMVRSLPGAANDVLRAVQSLPGVGRNAYNLGGLVLRGSNPIDADVFLDGIEVPIAFHFGGLSSFYPSTLLDELHVNPGGADVDRSRNLGGIVELTSRAPRRDRIRIGAEIGVLDASTYAEAPTFLGGAVAIGVRRSYIDAILAAVLPKEKWVLPFYFDGQVRWDLPVAGGTLSSLVFFSDDQVRVEADGGGGFTQYFARAALRWQRRAGANTWMALVWGGENSLGIDTAPEDDNDTHFYRNPFGARAELRRDMRWGQLAGGVDVQGSRVILETIDATIGDTPAGTARWTADVGFWSEGRWRIADGKLTLKPGLRADYFGTANLWRLDPRAVATHELAPWLTLRETLGVHHVAPAAAAVFEETAKHDDTGRSYHASIGAQVRAGGWQTSATYFHYQAEGPTPRSPLYDPYRTPPDPEPPSTGSLSIIDIILSNALGEELGGPTTTRARSNGFELSAQRRTERWMFWLAYTYSRSERNAWGTLEGWLPFNLDQTHDLSAVASVQLGPWQLGARLRWSTGLPYTPVLGVTVVGETRTPIVGPPMSQRLPDFLSVDLRMDRRWRRGWGTIGVFLDVQNVTNRWNPEAVAYDQDGFRDYVRGLPILPMFGVSLEPP